MARNILSPNQKLRLYRDYCRNVGTIKDIAQKNGVSKKAMESAFHFGHGFDHALRYVETEKEKEIKEKARKSRANWNNMSEYEKRERIKILISRCIDPKLI